MIFRPAMCCTGMTSNPVIDVRLPARAELDAAEPDWLVLPDSRADTLLDWIGESGKLYRLGKSHSDIAGYYRLENAAGRQFIKIVLNQYLDSQIAADEIARFAASHVNAATLLGGYPKRVATEHSALAYSWIDQAGVSPSTMCYQLGRELARLHQVLRGYPRSGEVQANGIQRLTALQTFYDNHRAEIVSSRQFPVSARAHMSESCDLFELFEDSCQVVHGDLNAGNLRWDGNRLWFFDFEDARFAWFPVCLDVAFAIERHALINEPNDERAFANARELLRGYCDVSGQQPFAVQGSLLASIKWWGVRSLIMLAGFEQRGEGWPASEWRKFEKLFKHLNERVTLLQRLEREDFG